MPRKLLYDSQRGWYGWEGHFNSVLRMSVASMFATNVRNERERFLHRKAITQIHDDRAVSLQSMDREMKKIKRELTDMSAYGIVYRQNSFIKWEEKKRNADDKNTSSESIQEMGNKTQPQRLPPIPGKRSRDADRADANRDSGVGATLSHGSAANLIMWRGFAQNPIWAKENKTYCLKQDGLPIMDNGRGVSQTTTLKSRPNSNEMDKSKKAENKGIKHSVNVRKLKLRERQHDKVSTVLPEGCKGVFFVRRFIDKETDRFLKEMSPSNIRKMNAERRIKHVQIPKFIDHRRSTSAIMREYQIHKSKTCIDEPRKHVPTKFPVPM